VASEVLSEPEQLRDWLVSTLTTNADFQGVKVLSRKVANIQNEIAVNLGKDAALVLVLIPSAMPTGINSTAVVLDPVRIIFRCVTGISNKTGKSAFYLATRVAKAMQMKRPPFDWVNGPLRPEEPGMRELNIVPADPAKDEDNTFAGWDVFYATKLTIAPR
jgi:hypothetical protein